MTVVSGRVQWGENVSSSASQVDKNTFFRMKDDGDYIIALLEGAPQPYKEHWTKNTEGKGRSVRCALRNCTVCKEADQLMASNDESKRNEGKRMRAKDKYAIEAFVVADKGESLGTAVGRPAIFEMTRQVYEGVSSIKGTLDKVGGSLLNSMLHINRKLDRKPNVYNVTLVPMPVNFNDQQKRAIEQFKSKGIDLGKLYAPPTDEENLRRLGRIGGGPMSDDPQSHSDDHAPSGSGGGGQVQWSDTW